MKMLLEEYFQSFDSCLPSKLGKKLLSLKVYVFSLIGNITRAPHAGANALLQLLLENSTLKRGITMQKKT